MKIRFKLRTLLFFTAVFGIFLAGQVHVHNKAKRFAEEMRELSKDAQEKLLRDAGVNLETHDFLKGSPRAVRVPPKFADVLLIRRTCNVSFICVTPKLRDDGKGHEHRYRFHVFGNSCEPEWEVLMLPK